MGRLRLCPLIRQVIGDDMRKSVLAELPDVDTKFLNVLIQVELLEHEGHFDALVRKYGAPRDKPQGIRIRDMPTWSEVDSWDD